MTGFETKYALLALTLAVLLLLPVAPAPAEETDDARDALRSSVDSDGDGQISRDERHAAREARREERRERRLERYDGDGDGSLSDDDLMGRAEGLALNMSEFQSCYESDRHTAEVAQSFEDGRALGVSGTPTFFVNGLVLPGSQTFETLKVVVEDELREVSGA